MIIKQPKRILHIADVHIFPKKRHQEFKEQINKLCSLIIREKVELVYIGGDVVDSKARLTPEQVEIVTHFFYQISNLCPIVMIPGNHDLDLKQSGSLDSLTPIVYNINATHPIYYLKDTGIYTVYDIDWVVWSCIDKKNPFEVTKEWKKERTTIGCYHGAVKGCTTDSDWTLTTTEISIDEFANCDVVMLGDIHKRQCFRNDEIAYSGSWLQVNIAESEEKGVLIWSEDKGKYKSTFHQLQNDYGFRTYEIQNLDTFDIDKVTVPTNKYILRLLYTGTEEDFSTIKFYELRKDLKLKFPNDIILQKRFKKTKTSKVKTKTLTDTSIDFFNKFYEEQGLGKEQIEELKTIDKYYNKLIDSSDYQIGEYYIEEVEIENFLCYGSKNVLSFTSLHGLTGLFSPNRWGKSSILSSVLFCCFNDTLKGVSSISSLINDQMPENTQAYVQVKLNINGVSWRIKRTIIPTSTGGKIKLEVYETVEGKEVPRHEESRPQTDNKVLRKLLGTKEVFLTTVLCTATNLDEFSKSKNSERLDLIMKFLGISIYDQKLKLCDEDLKKKSYLYDKLQEELEKLTPLNILQDRKDVLEVEKSDNQEKSLSLREEIEKHHQWNSELETKIKALNIIDITKSLVDLKRELNVIDDDLKSKNLQLEKLQKKEEQLLSGWTFDTSIDTTFPFADLSKDKENIVQLRIDLKSLEDQLSSEICPTCYQVRNKIDKEQIKKEIEAKTKQLSSLKESIEKIESEYKQIREQQSLYKETKTDISLISSKIELALNKKENLEQQISIVNDNKLKLEKKEKHEQKILHNQTQIKLLTKEQQQVESQILFIDKELNIIASECLKYNEKIESLKKEEENIKGLQLYKKGMHRTGIPSLILETYIPEINSEINNQVNDLFDLNIKFELIDNKLDISFYYDELLNKGKGKRDISQASGMEGTIINLAIRATLTKISLLPKPSLLMLDEVFNTLDKENLQLIKPLLVRLKEQYYNIVIVSHLDEIKDLPEHIIQLEKINGVTIIL